MVIVIGGGGAGLYFAWKYKEKHPNNKVIVIEEHKEIGKPIQCTGILTKEIEKFISKKDFKKFVKNKITKTTVFSPNNSFTTKISNDYIIDNVLFIKYLHNKAVNQGVEVKEGFRYVENKKNIILIKNLETKKITKLKDSYLIGADGPSSLVAKNNNLYEKREFLTGVQARIELKNFDKEKIDFYPYIGEYSWFTPESDEIARVGVAAKKNAKKIFDNFIKKYSGKIIDMQGGPIPLHKPGTKVAMRIKNFNVLLLGDAALQIKNTTGGGIIPGLKAANVLAENIDLYEKKLGKLNRELYTHYLLNKAFQNYSEKDWETLINRVKHSKINNILEKTHRDNSISMILKMIVKPKMVVEGLKAVRKIKWKSKKLSVTVEKICGKDPSLCENTRCR